MLPIKVVSGLVGNMYAFVGMTGQATPAGLRVFSQQLWQHSRFA